MVERIVQHRWVPKYCKATRGHTMQKEYLIKWAGEARNTTENWRSAGELNTGGMISRQWLDYEKLLGDEAPPPMKAKRQARLALALWEYSENQLTHVNSVRGEAPRALDHRSRTPRVLVLFSGTGSVERAILKQFPLAQIVTVDMNPKWGGHTCVQHRRVRRGRRAGCRRKRGG